MPDPAIPDSAPGAPAPAGYAAFPETKGFSRTNLPYMRAFAEAWPDKAIVQQLAGQIPRLTWS